MAEHPGGGLIRDGEVLVKGSTGRAREGEAGMGDPGSRKQAGLARLCFPACAAVVLLLHVVVAPAEAYTYQKTITINSGQVSGGPLTNFPLLFSTIDPDLRTVGNGGRVQNANGWDIIFKGLDDVTCGGVGLAPCALNHEIEKYVATTGEYVAWVRVPSINNGTVLNIYYGDSTVLSTTENVNGVWNTNYKAVWHLKETPPATVNDSTSNANNGTPENSPTQAAGQIDGSLLFDGTSDRDVNVPNSASLQLGTTMTVSAWARTSSADAQARLIVAKWKTAQVPPANNYWLGKLNNANFAFVVDQSQSVQIGLGIVNDNTFHYIVGVADATLLRLYVDGVQQNTAAYTGTSQTGTSELRIGRSPDATVQDWNGPIDEVRISNAARSAGWILTEYNNQSSPSTFYAVAIPVYYSVGTSFPADLKSGAPTVTIATGLATFSLGQPNNIGVGDEITYNGSTKAYISRRTSSTVYAVTTAAGTVPPDVSGAAVNSITRAFGTLTAAVAGSSDVNHLNTSNLVTANLQLHWAAYNDGAMNDGGINITGYTTGPANYIRIFTPLPPTQVGTRQRHAGVAGSGFRLRPIIDLSSPSVTWYSVLYVFVNYIRVEGIEIDGSQITQAAGVLGIRIDQTVAPTADIRIDKVIIHDITNSSRFQATNAYSPYGIEIEQGSARVSDSIIYAMHNNNNNASSDTHGIRVSSTNTGTLYIHSNTIYDIANLVAAGGLTTGISRSGSSTATVTVKNTVSMNVTSVGGSPTCFGGTMTQSNNVSSDATASGAGSQINKTSYSSYFANITAGSQNFHILNNSNVLWGSYGADLRSDPNLPILDDIDGQTRPSQPDIGADQTIVTTAVTLQSFAAQGLDFAVELSWQTSSELNNLGFNLYRSLASAGPYQRITSSVIPGLGSSPVGASYSYLDSGLSNGTTYYYELEDIETTGKTTLHGPVSATPQPSSGTMGGGTAGGTGTSSGSGSGTSSGSSSGSSSPARITYGNPSAVSLHVLEQDQRHVLLELLTPGFFATPNADGSVRLEVPGFVSEAPPGSPALPTLRTWVEAVAGRAVRLDSIRASDAVGFSSLRPTAAGLPEMGVDKDGTIHARFRPRREGRAFRRAGLVPREPAQVLETGFQAETKKAEIEIAPLRWDPSSQRLLLARRMLVRVVFAGVEPNELSFGGSRGHRRPRSPSFASSGVLAWLTAHDAGLYAVRFEDVFPSQRRSIPSSQLRLSYQGQPVGFHIEPSSSTFGPGSLLYFLSQGASLDPYGDAVYALEKASGGLQMPAESASPSGSSAAYSFQHTQWEVNRLYEGGLLDALDLWMWDGFITSLTKTFTIDHLASSQEPTHLSVFLQGASDFEANPDHHVRASLNGIAVGEVTWDGKTPMTLLASVSPGILLEGENTLSLENVPDIQAPYSLVYLDRFTLDYPRQTLASSGRFEGRFSFGGEALVPGLDSSTRLVDTTAEPARWLTGATASPSGFFFRAEAERRYLAVSDLGLLHPQVRLALSSSLKATRSQADYILIGPKEFLPAAQPLLDLRRSQGLHVMAVAVEDVYDAFGFGEPRPEAIRDFLAFAFHNWQAPAPRYVLLLGDATYDPKNFMGTGVVNRVPPLMVKTSFMWTVSDPTLAAVNGNDTLPDLAIGRLPAASLDEATVMVDKIVAFEKAGFSLLHGQNVIVADNPDLAGNFEADAQDIATTFFAGKPLEEIFLSQQGAATRSTILAAFNGGASLVSYIGHGSTAVWASENVFNSWDVPNLLAQPQQPFLMTLNCLNGYFLPPQFNSLAEAMLKADGKGAIASFSPSSLSLNDAAHLYHKALLREILSGRYERVGDALLAAQADYATTGAFPEALAIYHLIGDPALRIR